MYKRGISLIGLTLLLSGCWDEQNFNETIHVPMAGISVEEKKLIISLALPAIERKVDEARTITIKSETFQEARASAGATTHNQIDTSMLTALVIEDKAATTDIYTYLDGFYRDVRNRLGMVLLISEGPATPLIESGTQFGGNINTFYADMVSHLIDTSHLPQMDLQIACTFLFDEAIDLQLPYVKIDEESGYPTITGVALFNNKKFTGQSIPMDQMVLMQLLKDGLGKKATDSFLFKDVPLSYEIEKLKRSIHLDDTTVKLDYSLNVSVLDYPPDRIKESAERVEIEKAIEVDLNQRALQLFQQMQAASHDGLGLGRYYRAFKPDLYSDQTWAQTYMNLVIEPTFEVEINDSGIMD